MKRVFSLILAALLLTGCSIGKGGDYDAAATAISSGDLTVTKGMMTYFFQTTYQQYDDEYAYYYGIDSELSLKEQDCVFEDVEGSWFDFFMSEAKVYASELLALCEAATEAGVALDEAELAVIDANIAQLKENAELEDGQSFDDLLTEIHGSEITEADVRDAMAMQSLGTKYATLYQMNLTYTDADLDAYYSENSEQFDMVDVLVFTPALKDFGYISPDETGVDTSESTYYREAEALMYEWVERLKNAADNDEFRDIVKEYLIDVRGNTLRQAEDAVRYYLLEGVHADDYLLGGRDVAEWAFAASVGDTKLFTVDGTTCEVYRLVRTSYRDETVTRSVSHILFDTDYYDSNTSTREEAEAVYAEWEASGFDADTFNSLCATYSKDANTASRGGTYTGIVPGSMVVAFNDWTFSSSRTPGDHALIESAYGYHIMNYIGETGRTVWQTEALDSLVTNAYNALLDTYVARNSFDDAVINSIEA